MADDHLRSKLPFSFDTKGPAFAFGLPLSVSLTSSAHQRSLPAENGGQIPLLLSQRADSASNAGRGGQSSVQPSSDMIQRFLERAGVNTHDRNNVDARDDKGQTPLFTAIENDDMTAADALLKAGADVTICAWYGQSALYCAKSSKMRQLLARAWPQDDPRRLYVLANADLTDEVAEAVAAGADVNARDELGQTPLFCAVKKDSLAAAEALIKAGADVNARDEMGRTPLCWAVQKDSLAAAEVLIEAGVDVNARGEMGRTPLCWAVQKDSLAAAETLIKAGADVMIRNLFGQRALDCTKSSEMRQLLAGAWPQDDPRRLHALAAADLADEVVDAVTAGADVNARDEKGQTPLFWASRQKSLAAAEALIEAGADVTVCDNRGQRALDCAKSSEMRQLLAGAWPQDDPRRLHALAAADLADEVVDAVAAGADVNARDEQGQTPLFWASRDNSLDAAEALIEAGADVTVCDNRGRSTLYCAKSSKMRQLLTIYQ